MFEDSASVADGVGVDEFPTQESILQRITSSQLVLIGENKDNGELAVVYLLYPSPIVRSEKPIYHSGYHIIAKGYRKIGLGQLVWALAGASAVHYFGYHGLLGRTGTMSKALTGLMNSPFLFLGVIPRSILVAGKGMTDDLIVFSQYGKRQERIHFENLSLPALQVLKMKPYDDITFTPIPITTSAGTFTLRPGAPDDTERMEHLIREAAENGEGFGMDEFKSNGQFNRAFFQRCHLAVLCDSNRSIVGAALFGLSSLVRTATLDTSHIYIIIDKEHHNKGIGQKLFKEMLALIHSVGYSRIITDVYHNNNPALHICHKMNFLVTASIPDCGYFNQTGFCSSYFFADSSNCNNDSNTAVPD